MANLQQKAGDMMGAEDNFVRAMELAPKSRHPLIKNNLAWVYIETGRYVEAEHLMIDFYDDNISEAHIYKDTLATAYSFTGNLLMAKRLYMEAITTVPPTDMKSQLSLYSHIRTMYIREGNISMVYKLDEILKKLEMGIPANVLDLGIEGLK